jgi:hypothetical protein
MIRQAERQEFLSQHATLTEALHYCEEREDSKEGRILLLGM